MRQAIAMLAIFWVISSGEATAQGWMQPYADTNPTYCEFVEDGMHTTGGEIVQVEAFAWVQPATPVGDTVAIVAEVVWLFNEQAKPERLTIGSLRMLRYVGFDGQGLSLERRQTSDTVSEVRPGKITSLNDCMEDVERRFSYTVVARQQALFTCQSGWRGWTPSWTSWQPVRLPKVAAFTFAGSTPLKLGLGEMDSQLPAAVFPGR